VELSDLTQSGMIGEWLAAAARGTSSIVLVEGGVGEGKTTLLINTVLAALDRHFQVAVGADPLAVSGPGGLIPMQDNCQIMPLPGDASGIAQLCTWLAQQTGRPAHSRRCGNPGLIALDDLHELNGTGAKMLMALLGRSLSDPVMWLLFRREGGGNLDVARLFALDHPQVSRVRLRPLEPPHTERLVTELVGVAPARRLLELAAQAGGNRLLIVELVNGLRAEHGRAALRTGSGLRDAPLPERLQHAADRLLSPVSADCRKVLEVAAAAGPEVSLSRLAALTGEPVGVLLPLLLEGINNGVLVRGPDDRLRFAQELLRRALIARVPGQVLRDLAEAARWPVPSAAVGATAGQTTAGEATARQTTTGQTSAGQTTAGQTAGGQPTAGQAAAAVAPAARQHRNSGRYLRSNTERVIAELVSDGLTNRQIAARMVLSEHTVNYHLRKIFRRLRIRSRVELAGWVHQHERMVR
jgi:DNA-binding CsgD family transcriptional regulator